MVRPAVNYGCGWKKKTPAKEKGGSRLQLLERLKRAVVLAIFREGRSFGSRWLLLLLLLGSWWWREKSFAEKRGRERELLLASVRLLGDGWDVVFQGKDGGEINGGS